MPVTSSAPLGFALRHPRRVRNNRRTVRDSALAHRWLDGLAGSRSAAPRTTTSISTRSTSIARPRSTRSTRREERHACGRAMPVDLVAPGDDSPFADAAFDFVLASHVLEHFPDPIRALRSGGGSRAATSSWCAAPRPHVRPRPPAHAAVRAGRAPRAGLRARTTTGTGPSGRWRASSQLCAPRPPVLETLDPDDKTGNGFMVVLDAT